MNRIRHPFGIAGFGLVSVLIGRFGSTTGPWTTDMFVEAVYNSLKEKK